MAYSLVGGGPRKAIFFHGHPGSRVQATFFLEPHAKTVGIEVAAFDRAGFGHSTDFPSLGAPLDLSGAVLALANSLGWERFHLIAVSGGAPYALNSLAGLGSRALSLQLVCGLGPLHEKRFRGRFPFAPLQALRLGAWLPSPLLAGAVKIALRSLGRSGARRGGRCPRYLSAGDFALLHSPTVGPGLRASLESAFRQGVGGAQRDLRAFLSPWNVDYKGLPCPVTFWHGRSDLLVPCEFSEWLSMRIPGSQLFTLEGEGHYTLPLTRAAEILKKIP